MAGECPPITIADLHRSVEEVRAALEVKARHLDGIDTAAIAERISKAVSLIDISKTARAAINNASGDAYLEQAREILLRLLGS